MRFPAIILVVALVAACAPAEEAAEQTAQTPSGPTLADFAGTWEVMATLQGNENPVPSTMSGSADGSGWTMTLEGRPAIPMQVSIMGDSLVGQTTEYESILRAGVMVSLRTASVLTNGMLEGNLVATYKTPEGEEQVMGTLRASRRMN